MNPTSGPYTTISRASPKRQGEFSVKLTHSAFFAAALLFLLPANAFSKTVVIRAPLGNPEITQPSNRVAAGRFAETVKNVPAGDIRRESAVSYLQDFLGGNGSGFLSHPRVMDVRRFEYLFWLRASVFPASSWAWRSSVIGQVSSDGGDLVTVQATMPDVTELFSPGVPRVAAEIETAMRIFSGDRTLEKKIRRTPVTRELRISNSGKLLVADDMFDKMTAYLEKELTDSLEWISRGKRVHFLPYLRSMAAEASASGTFRMSKNVFDALTKTIELLNKK